MTYSVGFLGHVRYSEPSLSPFMFRPIPEKSISPVQPRALLVSSQVNPLVQVQVFCRSCATRTSPPRQGPVPHFPLLNLACMLVLSSTFSNVTTSALFVLPADRSTRRQSDPAAVLVASVTVSSQAAGSLPDASHIFIRNLSLRTCARM